MINFKLHFIELKLKLYYFVFSLFITFFVSYFFASNLISILSYPFLKFVAIDGSDFIFTSVFEVFNTYYMLAFYSCFFFNIPFGLYLIFTFIRPGLFRYEKKNLFLTFKFFIHSLVFSSLFSYYIIFPFMLFFLLNFDLITDTSFVFIKMETKIYEYVVFFCKFLFLYCFVIFQIPTLFFIFAFLKRPTSYYIISKRKFWVLFCLIVGCLFSSPDLISLFIVSIPFLLCFEVLIYSLILKSNYKTVCFYILESCLNGKRQVC